mgnify:CR=1 FL=1
MGKVCLARNSSGELYRAFVNGIADEKVIIRCVDYGHCEVKSRDDIFAIPKEYLKQPPAVIEIWPARRFEKSERRELLRKFVGKNFAVRVSQFGSRRLARFYENTVEIQFGVDLKFETNVLAVKNEPLKINLSYVEKVEKVWVQETSTSSSLEFVMEKISSLETRKCLSPTKGVGRKVGDFVVARYQEDQEMYRAQIIDIRTKEVTIHFVDFGNKQTSYIEDIFELPESVNLTLYPAFAYFVDLKIGGSFDDSQENRKTLESLMNKENLSILRNRNKEIEVRTNDQAIDLKSCTELLLERSRFSSCKVASSLKDDSGPMVECLREADNLEDMPLKLPAEPDKKKPQRKMSINLEGTLDQDPGDDIIILSPRLRTSTKGSNKNVQEMTRHRWRLGDKVLAFLISVNSWKEGVIHELDLSTALVVAKDNNLRPEYINLSLIKPVSMPQEALNRFEMDVGNLIKSDEKQQAPIPVINVKAKTINNNDIELEKGTKAQVTMTPSMVFTSTSDEFCQFARSGAGSRFLQSLVAPHNTKLCQRMLDLLLSSDSNLRMMTNAKSSFIIRKLLMHLDIFPPAQQERFLAEIETLFSWLACDKFGYHIALIAVNDLGPVQRTRFLNVLENKPFLLGVIKNPHGTFVAQACIPHFTTSTINFVVNCLLGHSVGLCQNKQGAFFIEKFLSSWGHLTALNLFVEDIINHLRGLAHCVSGWNVIKTLLKIRDSYTTLSKVVDWVLLQIEAVYKDNIAIRVADLAISKLNEKVKKTKELQWTELLDKIVFKLLIGQNSEGRAHIVTASCHPTGNVMVMTLIKNSRNLSSSVRTNLMTTISSYRTVLSADHTGCQVVRAARDLN